MTSSDDSSLISLDAIPPVGPSTSYLNFESRVALDGYIKELRTLSKGRKFSTFYRLHQPISLLHVAAQRFIGGGRIPSRPPPRFQQSDIPMFVGDLIFRNTVRRPVGGVHAWIADVVALDDKKAMATPLARVVLRVLQQSMMPLPDSDDAEDTDNGCRVFCRSPLDILGQEYRMYEDMKELQGSVIPYCLGLHQVRLPHVY